MRHSVAITPLMLRPAVLIDCPVHGSAPAAGLAKLSLPPRARYKTNSAASRPFLPCRLRRHALLCQHRLGEAHPIARTERQHVVVKIVMRIVQYSATFRSAIADPDISPGLLLEKARKILGRHARQQV